MKKFLVRIYGNYERLHKELVGMKLIFVEECVQHLHSKHVTVIATEEQLKVLQEKYEVKLEGELKDIAARLQEMVGKGNRFENDVLNAGII